MSGLRQSVSAGSAVDRVKVPTLAQAKKMSADELFALYNKGAAATSWGIRCMAVAYVALRESGADVSVFQHGLVKYFDRIVSGRVLPQLLLEYAGAPQHLEQLSKLVPEERAKVIGADAVISVARRGSDGKIEAREKSPAACSVMELAVAVGEGRLRSADEQAHYLAPPARFVTPTLPSAADDVDVWRILTVNQRNSLAASAQSREISVAEYLRDMLVRQKVIRGKAA